MALPVTASSFLFSVVAIAIVAAVFTTAADIPEITPEELYDGIESGRFDAIIDVRRPDEWETGHIPDATWLPNLQEAVEIPVELTGCRDCGTKTIVVYCKSGGRSAAAIEHLQSLGGFEDVTVYTGMGVVQWTDAGYDLVSTDSATPAGCNVDDCPVNNAAEDPEDVESTNNSTPTALPADASSAGILDGASRIILFVLPAAIIVATVGAVW